MNPQYTKPQAQQYFWAICRKRAALVVLVVVVVVAGAFAVGFCFGLFTAHLPSYGGGGSVGK